MQSELLIWIGFNLFVLALLALDLGVFHRAAHAVSLKEAAIWSAVWIALAFSFNLVVYLWRGPEVALQFFTGYLIEKALSVDNIFVFVLIFAAFGVPAVYQHRVLFYGILGALVMRGMLIGLGTALVSSFHWVLYLFGAFLIVTGIKMARHQPTEVHPGQNPLVRLLRRFFPLTAEYVGQRFVVRRDGRLWATPLLLVLLVVESTDLVFALDSIPAIFAITTDPFIVYTSNVFAILGLRALYFLLADSVRRFAYLQPGLAAVLVFVGLKMVLADLYKIPIAVSLGVIGTILTIAIGASIARARRQARQTAARSAAPRKRRELVQ